VQTNIITNYVDVILFNVQTTVFTILKINMLTKIYSKKKQYEYMEIVLFLTRYITIIFTQLLKTLVTTVRKLQKH